MGRFLCAFQISVRASPWKCLDTMTSNDSTTSTLANTDPDRLDALVRQPLADICGVNLSDQEETKGDLADHDITSEIAKRRLGFPQRFSKYPETVYVWADATRSLPSAARARTSTLWLDWIQSTSATDLTEFIESKTLEAAIRTLFSKISYINARLAVTGLEHSAKWQLLQRIHSWQFDKIKALYSLRNQERVRLFLYSNPFLFELLGHIRTNISEHLSGAEVYLEVVKDPEIPDEVQIIVSVVADQPFDDLCASFDRFEETWWLDNLYRAQEKVCVLLEFA